MENNIDKRVSMLEANQKRLIEFMEKVQEALWEDDGDDMGLIPRVKTNSGKLDRIERLAWIIVALLITTAGGIFYQLAITHPSPLP